MIHRFDNSGTILSSVTVGLPISGLAYNPDSKHLFVMTSGSTTRVYVLDVANNYAVLGQFSVNQGFGGYAGAGLEFDCDGNLWALDLNTNTVYQFGSGEAASICHRDVSWVSTQPVSGTLGTGVGPAGAGDASTPASRKWTSRALTTCCSKSKRTRLTTCPMSQ